MDPQQRIDHLRQVVLELPDGEGGESSLRRLVALWNQDPLPLPPDVVAEIRSLYARLPEKSSLDGWLLGLLAAAGNPESLEAWGELMRTDPPRSDHGASQAFAPLLRRPGPALTELFPALFDALRHRSVAGYVLDLSNFVVRRGLARQHPASGQGGRLSQLLRGLVHELHTLEAQIRQGQPPPEAARKIADGVSLAVSCCDALGLIGDASHTPSLFQALEVAHRRVQVEAAYALARLKEPTGRKTLAALAEHPLMRLRVLAYASELGMLDEIEPELRGERSRAEALLVSHLSQPSQWGSPPCACMLRDERLLNWPGSDAPVRCFLWEYTYPTPDGPYTNVGFAGPFADSVQANLRQLKNRDVYALFAGWHTAHPELTVAPAHTGDLERHEMTRALMDQAEGEGFELDRVELVGAFFGQPYIVASAKQQSQAGTAIVDPQSVSWFPADRVYGPLSIEQHRWIYVGRKLLDAFNPPDDAPEELENSQQPQDDAEDDPRR